MASLVFSIRRSLCILTSSIREPLNLEMQLERGKVSVATKIPNTPGHPIRRTRRMIDPIAMSGKRVMPNDKGKYQRAPRSLAMRLVIFPTSEFFMMLLESEETLEQSSIPRADLIRPQKILAFKNEACLASWSRYQVTRTAAAQTQAYLVLLSDTALNRQRMSTEIPILSNASSKYKAKRQRTSSLKSLKINLSIESAVNFSPSANQAWIQRKCLAASYERNSALWSKRIPFTSSLVRFWLYPTFFLLMLVWTWIRQPRRCSIAPMREKQLQPDSQLSSKAFSSFLSEQKSLSKKLILIPFYWKLLQPSKLVKSMYDKAKR